MGLFTHVDAQGMAEIAARFRLGPVLASEGVEAGTVNSNYRLRTDLGTFFVRVNEGKSEDDVAYVGREIEALEPLASRRAALPQGVIHGDLFVDNVLRRTDGGLTLLDFEQASDGAYAYDLAVCLNAWCYGDAIVAERARALVDG